MTNSKNTSEPSLKLLYLLLLIIFSVWLLSFFSLYNMKERGTFGDMFGGVNALFSGCAFAGVIFAIFLQKKELELQRKELQYTRKELKGQKEQLKAQNLTFQKQNFESSFFQLLRGHNEIVNSIDITRSDITISINGPKKESKFINGRDCFGYFYQDYKRVYKKYQEEHPDAKENEIIKKSYILFYPEIQSDTGHYFLYLYNIVKYIEKSEISNKDFYTNLIRAQLSYDELCLLFYNCLAIPEENKFKPMIEDYAFFKNLPKNLLIDSKKQQYLYEHPAFGQTEIK